MNMHFINLHLLPTYIILLVVARQLDACNCHNHLLALCCCFWLHIVCLVAAAAWPLHCSQRVPSFRISPTHYYAVVVKRHINFLQLMFCWQSLISPCYSPTLYLFCSLWQSAVVACTNLPQFIWLPSKRSWLLCACVAYARNVQNHCSCAWRTKLLSSTFERVASIAAAKWHFVCHLSKMTRN